MVKQITYRIELNGSIAIFDNYKDIKKKILAETRPFIKYIYKNLYYNNYYEVFYVREINYGIFRF